MDSNFVLVIYDRERGIRLEKTVEYKDIDEQVLLLYERDFEVEELPPEVIKEYKLEKEEIGEWRPKKIN